MTVPTFWGSGDNVKKDNEDYWTTLLPSRVVLILDSGYRSWRYPADKVIRSRCSRIPGGANGEDNDDRHRRRGVKAFCVLYRMR
jgi:hypothetical protein